jgi:hypothetical protein
MKPQKNEILVRLAIPSEVYGKFKELVKSHGFLVEPKASEIFQQAISEYIKKEK